MKSINEFFRTRINRLNRKKLKNTDFSLIASNCNGAFILHDLGLPFNSPTVNLWIAPGDYIKFLQNLDYYLKCDMTFIQESGISYPIGLLDDVKIYFQHYATPEEAKDKWIERTHRIHRDNIFIMFTDRDGCQYQDLVDFDALPYQKKVVFTHLPYPELKSARYIKGWEDQSCVGPCYEYKGKLTGKKYYDDFDYTKWFNEKP